MRAHVDADELARVPNKMREHRSDTVGAHEHVVVGEQHGVRLEACPHCIPIQQSVAAHLRHGHLSAVAIAGPQRWPSARTHAFDNRSLQVNKYKVRGSCR